MSIAIMMRLEALEREVTVLRGLVEAMASSSPAPCGPIAPPQAAQISERKSRGAGRGGGGPQLSTGSERC